MQWNGEYCEVAGRAARVLGDGKVKVYSSTAKVFTHRDNVSLVADELKSIFGTIKCGRQATVMRGKSYILYLDEDEDLPFTEVEARGIGFFPDDVRKSFIFRWACGFSCLGEKSLMTRIDETGARRVFSYGEKEIKNDSRLKVGCSMMKRIEIKYFGGNFTDFLKMMFKGVTYFDLHEHITRVIGRIDPSMLWWADFICRRIFEVIG
jgi:hypothetical protein